MNVSVNYSKVGTTRSVGSLSLVLTFLLLSFVFCHATDANESKVDSELDRFKSAWRAAERGDHDDFNQIRLTLKDYVLYPYLQYEDYRNRRSAVPVEEMADFLETYRDLAFYGGLRQSWLKSLARKGRWADLVAHSEGVSDTILRCQRVRGQIILNQTEGVLSEAQALWTVGKSQPDECDPVFAWLKKNDGITETIAWERIHLTIKANNRGLTQYLARFVSSDHRAWLADWQKLSRAGYSRLEHMRSWPDNRITRMIAATSLQTLARKDASLAARKFQLMNRHFSWSEERKAELLREIALWSAVELDKDTDASMRRVPVLHRDSQLLEWWARFLLSKEDWKGLVTIIEQMPEDTRNDDRWSYWLAQAMLRSGQAGNPSKSLRELADKANYYGFLAADELGLSYSICPQQPDIDAAAIDQIASIDGFRRALELRKAGLDDWAVREWSLAANRVAPADLKAVAGLAKRENWHDRAIFALGDSGDLQLYEWRFPLIWEDDIKREATAHQLDPAWVYGTIRSESAMVETARSSANALGLMQVTPATGKRVARKHGLAWSGSNQLKTVAGNLPIGTAFMSDLLQDYSYNPVLVSGSYNAGPHSVSRWLDSRPMGEAAIWIETLPYFETRDYIPRVLAFTTLYDWRLGGSVTRISARMPHIESGKIGVKGSTQVECRDFNDELALRN